MQRYAKERATNHTTFEIRQADTHRSSLSKTIMTNSKCFRRSSLYKRPMLLQQAKWDYLTKQEPQVKDRSSRCNMLQQWLNQALSDSQTTRQFHAETLGTIRKFWLDRRHLHNTNIPQAKVQQMYRSLFVYSEGLRTTFQQLLSEVEGSQRPSTMQHYWDAFVRLIQNTNPIKTCFQLIQEQYKTTITKLEQSLENEKSSKKEFVQNAQEEINKKEKRLDQMEKQMQALRIDFLIVDSTLKLTEQSLNNQLSTRLKFQEKINSVYGAYNEVKDKHQRLKEDLGCKISSMEDQQIEFRTLHQHLITQRITNQQLNLKLQNAINQINQKQLQIRLLLQQLTEAKIKLQGNSVLSDQPNKNDVIDNLKNGVHSLQISIKEKDAQMTTMNDFLKEIQQRLQLQKETISNCREKNDDLFAKCYQSDSIIEQKNTEITSYIQLLKQRQETILTLENTNTQLQSRMKSVQIQNSKCSQQLSLLKVQLQCKRQNLLRNSEILQSLREIKGKYERQNEILVKQLEQSQETLAQQSKSLSMEIGNGYNAQLQLNKLKDSLKYLEGEREKEKEQFCRVQNEYANDVDISNKTIVHLKGSLEEARQLHRVKEKEWNEDKIRISALESKLLHQADEQAYLHSLVPTLRKEQEILKTKANTILTQYQQLKAENSYLRGKIGGVALALDKKQTEVVGEIEQLHSQLQYHRILLKNKENYIAPMLYEDCLSSLYRIQEKYNASSSQIAALDKQLLHYEQAIVKEKEGKDSLRAEIAAKKKECIDLKRQWNKISQEKKQIIRLFQGKMKQIYMNKEQEINKQKQKYQLLLKEIEQKQVQKNIYYKEIKQKQNMIEELKERIKLSVRKVPDVRQRQCQTNPLALVEEKQMQTEIQYKEEHSFQSSVLKNINQPIVQQFAFESPILINKQKNEAAEKTTGERKTQTKTTKQTIQKDFKRSLKLSFLRK